MKRVVAFALFLLVACSESRLSQKKPRPDLAQVNEAYNYRVELAVSYLRSGSYKKALIEAAKAKKLKDTPEVENIIGLAYLGLGELEKAKASFSKALQMDPAFSEAWTNLSACYLAEANWKKALEAAEKALQNEYYTKPEAAYTNVARALLGLGREKDAVSALKKAIRYNPYYAPAYEVLIDYYLKKQDIAAARSCLEDALSLNLSSPGILFFTALFKMKDGEKEEARLIFKRIVLDYPLTVWAKKSRAYLKALE